MKETKNKETFISLIRIVCGMIAIIFGMSVILFLIPNLSFFSATAFGMVAIIFFGCLPIVAGVIFLFRAFENEN